MTPGPYIRLSREKISPTTGLKIRCDTFGTQEATWPA